MDEDQDSAFPACNSAVPACNSSVVVPAVPRSTDQSQTDLAVVWRVGKRLEHVLVFFQFLLLLGYMYAHALTRWATIGQQAFIHVSLLALSLVSLPVIASPAWKSGEGEPALRILLLHYRTSCLQRPVRYCRRGTFG